MLRSQWATPAHHTILGGWIFQMGVCHSLKAATGKSATEGRDWILDRGHRSLVDTCTVMAMAISYNW